MTNFALLFTRASLGLLFFLAGLRKLMPHGGKTFMSNLDAFVTSMILPKSPLPETLSKIYGYALPFVELIAGTLLVLGLFTRLSSSVILLLLISFIIAMGPAWWPAQGPAFSSNIVFAGVALLLACIGPGRFSLDATLLKKKPSKAK